MVIYLLREKWSPEQASGWLRSNRLLLISHETIYRHVWEDKRGGGTLHTLLRGARKKKRKRNGSYDSRGRLAGKRHISERPCCVERRRQLGHWEVDTVIGKGSRHCIVSAVERTSGFALIGKLRNRTAAELNRRLETLIERHRNRFRTITVDNGTEFHSYEELERATGTRFYFATPYQRVGAWQRREPQRAHPAVSAEADEHDHIDAGAMRCNCRQSQYPTAKALGLSNPGGVLLCGIVIVALQS
jgi:IS30 family transposase